MGLSSNILWHQTTKDALKKILKDKCFRFSYSLEHIESNTHTLECAFPMLSLCDIPFADIGEYITKYGGNSIGLSRKWGIRYGITPAIYCEPTSNLLNNIIDNLILQEKTKDINSFTVNLLSHIKNHEGNLPKYNYKRYRFYDEREVRIIPTPNDLVRVQQPPILLKKDYENYKRLHKNSSLLPENLNIPFHFNDIRYFILKDEKSIDEIKNILSKDINLSQSKISFFTHQQIKEDFIGENHYEHLIREKIDINNLPNNFPPIIGKIDVDNRNNR